MLALLLILVANSAPILIRHVPLFNSFTWPIDARIKFVDGRRLLGDSKTWRGVVTAVIATAICSAIFHKGLLTGFVVGLLAMCGDALSSFTKRRLGLRTSAMALGLDQTPESFLPLFYLHYHWQLAWQRIWLLVLFFIILELLLSRVLFRLHIRKRPY